MGHDGDFTSGNSAAVTHGGYSIIRRLKDGTPFVGLALDLQEAARSELETAGAIEAMKQAYSRHAACALFLFGILNGKSSLDESSTLRMLTELRRLNEGVFRMAGELHALDAAFDENVVDYSALVAARKAAQNEHDETG